MDEERAVSLVTLRGYTVDEQVMMWLHAKASLSGSARDLRAILLPILPFLSRSIG